MLTLSSKEERLSGSDSPRLYVPQTENKVSKYLLNEWVKDTFTFLPVILKVVLENDSLVPSLKSINTASPLICVVYDAYEGKDKEHDLAV